MCMSNEVLTSLSPQKCQIAVNGVGDTSACLPGHSIVSDSMIWGTGLIPERIQQHEFAHRTHFTASPMFSLFEQVLQHEAEMRLSARLGNVHGQCLR